MNRKVSQRLANLERLARTLESSSRAPARKKKPTRKDRKSKRKTVIQVGRRGRPISGKRSDVSVFGDRAAFSSNTSSIPSAFVNAQGNSTWLDLEGQVEHPDLGPGIAICGCQPFCDVVTTGGDTQFATGTALANFLDNNACRVGSDSLNGPLAAQANLHQKYVFTDLMFEYVSSVATTQNGAFVMGISTDGSGVARPTTFAGARQLVPSITSPFRAERTMLHYHYSGVDTWFTLLDNTSTASMRLTQQLVFTGFPSVTSLGAISMGYINVYYRCELYQPVSSQGFTVSVESPLERGLVQSFLRKMRGEKDGLPEFPPVDYDSALNRVLQRFDAEDAISDLSYGTAGTRSSRPGLCRPLT